MANPQKKTGKKKSVSSAASFKRKKAQELELPSGEVCLVKRPGMDKLLRAGVMPDTLTPIAMQHIKNAESGGRPSQDVDNELMEAVASDPAQMAEMFLSFDRATVMCVVEPKVRLHIYTAEDARLGLCEEDRVGEDIPEDGRDEDLLYTDEVDIADKMFIFQYVVGGSSDLEQFRREHGAGLEAAQSGQDVPGTPE